MTSLDLSKVLDIPIDKVEMIKCRTNNAVYNVLASLDALIRAMRA